MSIKPKVKLSTIAIALMGFVTLHPSYLWAEGDEAMSGMHAKSGALGNYTMTRDASGTSWQPQNTPMQAKHIMAGEWMWMFHGYANLVYGDQGGARGKTESFTESMLMAMGSRVWGPGHLTLRGMFSLDPLTMGKDGYSLLTQTGESADGITPLIDRQHPHDLFMELSATYSIPFDDHRSAFVYLGLPGEPALGPPTFMHRFSGMDNPEAPIGHHWLDSSHITFGVATLGFVQGPWKIEGSAFNGREPDQFRYNIETHALDSSSLRLGLNPTANWAFQLSRGWLQSPEQLEPDVDVERTTASAIYNHPISIGNWQTTLAWGRNVKDHSSITDAWLLESALTIGDMNTLFARIEQVDKDELFVEDDSLHGQIFNVRKFSLGGIHEVLRGDFGTLGIGVVASKHFLPDALTSSYGNDPASFLVFLRAALK